MFSRSRRAHFISECGSGEEEESDKEEHEEELFTKYAQDAIKNSS
jgi:hypothetical protein